MTDLLDASDPSVRAELGDIVAETLDGLSESSFPDTPLPAVFGHDGLAIEATVDIHGPDVCARLILRVSAPTAFAITAALTSESPDDLDIDDACGTVAELSNVVAGSVKTMYESETALHVPTAAARSIDDLSPLDAVVVQHHLGRFDVSLGACSP